MTNIELNALNSLARSLQTISSTLADIADELRKANELKAIEMGIYQDGVYTPHPLVAKVMGGNP